MTALHGRVAVVTGGGRGIGRSTAILLAQRGASVAVWDLDLAGARDTVATIRAEGGTALALGGDSSSRADVAQAAELTRAELGPVEILVNNAGVAAYESFTSLSAEAWDRMIGINLKGPFLVTQALIPDMLTAGFGRIVNLASGAAQSGAPDMAHYAASKGGVIGLTRALALEYIASGITVNAIAPGLIDTPLANAGPVSAEVAGPHLPMKRAGRPEEVASATAYLVSDQAGYVTGQTLSVNGGYYMT
jgi:2-hydroxycyclohexanecarboxyl-CoA dehydrogenase